MIPEFIEESLPVILILATNFSISLFYLFIINSKKLKSGFVSMNIILQKLFVLLFVGPLFVSPFVSQPRFAVFHWSSIPAGILITAAGALMIVFSFLKIGAIPSIKGKSGLLTSGTYGIVRHPIYSGTIIAFTGLIILEQAYAVLAYLPVSILLYYLMTVFEEKDLIKMFGDEYARYRKAVRKRLIPFIL